MIVGVFECKYELSRLLESVALPYCDKKRVSSVVTDLGSCYFP